MPRTRISFEMRTKAKGLRQFATRAESLLWYELRALKAEGLKFRRQSPIGPYIVDFVCLGAKLVVEVDGDSHETEVGKRHDAKRDAYLRSLGYEVMRVDAPDVLDYAWHVAQEIRARATEATPPGGSAATLPARGRDDAAHALDASSSLGTRSSFASFPRLAVRTGRIFSAPRAVPEEAPVALSYGGTTHAVMMATPADLEDFGLGFSLTEGVVGSADEIEGIEVVPLEIGFDVQIRLRDAANRRFEARKRRLAGPVGCGLCGIESIEEAMRRVADVRGATLTLGGEEVADAVRRLGEKQPLHAATGAVHAAGFYAPGRGVLAAREDAGRHNALDKLAGALARAGMDGRSGAVVVTSRVSVEMVQKTAAIGAGVLIAVSAPTALALRAAEEAGLTVAALVRGREFDLFTCPGRITEGAASDAA